MPEPVDPPAPEAIDPEKLVAGLVRLLTVSPVPDAAHFTGPAQPGGVGRVFGGQVIAQALQAAQASAPEGMVAHSLHASFLRGGTEGIATNYAVAADFTGRSFANRRVLASQPDDGTDKDLGKAPPILSATVGFQRPEPGLEHQDAEMPDVAPPEDLRPDIELRREAVARLGDRVSEAQRRLMLRPRPIDMRTSDRLHWMNSEPRAPHSHSWFRARARLPDDPALHRAVIAYVSDMTLMGTSALPHGLSWIRGEMNGASLDHAIWFHHVDGEEVRADEWLLYATDSPWSGGGRGFNRGRIFTRTGRLVASVAQEGMIRRRR